MLACVTRISCRFPSRVPPRTKITSTSSRPASSSLPLRHSHVQARAQAQVHGGAAPASSAVLLLDIMDTVVVDPFFKQMPKFFQLSFEELMKAKHPSAWLEFERDEISEHEMFKKFFADGREFDGAGLRQTMVDSYCYIEGMEELLGRLKASGIQMHAMSNYPMWYRLIEDKLKISQYMEWTFVSCTGPMKGLRKPAPEAYSAAAAWLDLPPGQLIFVDDRQVNVQGAVAVGLDGILFRNAADLEQQLLQRGLKF